MMKTPSAMCVASLSTAPNSFAGLAPTSDGSLLAIAPGVGELELWEISTGRCLSRFALPNELRPDQGSNEEQRDGVWSLAISDDGLFLAASFLGGDVLVWTFEGELLGSIKGEGGFVRMVCFLPATSLLVVVMRDTRLLIWDAMRQQALTILSGADARVPQVLSALGNEYVVCCSSDGSQIALNAATARNLVMIWNIESQGDQLHCGEQMVWQWTKEQVFREVKYRPGSTQFYHLTRGKLIEGYEAQSGQRVKQIKHTRDEPVTFCFSPSGNLLAVAGLDGRVSLWDLKKDEWVFQFDACPDVDPDILEYHLGIQEMFWLAQSRLLVTSGLKRQGDSIISIVKLWQLSF